MQITPDLIDYLQKLARIELTSDQQETVGKELQDILTYIDMLGELDTQGVEPLSHAFPVRNVMRADEVCPSSPNEKILANAPCKKDGCFMVPKTVE